jgi:hypothetical protein
MLRFRLLKLLAVNQPLAQVCSGHSYLAKIGCYCYSLIGLMTIPLLFQFAASCLRLRRLRSPGQKALEIGQVNMAAH